MTDVTAMQVPLLDLRAQYAALRDEVQPVINEVLESQYFIGGPAVGELEQAIAEYCGVAAAVGCSSGTDALLLALMAMGIGQDETGRDEVITTPYTFFATAGSLWRAGAKPVFVDIDPKTFNIDVNQIEAAVTDKTKAIMPVHLFGQMAEMDPIMAIAEKHGLKVIEDAAQAIGSSQNGKKAGSIGDVGCFSFFPSKNLGGAGDGGIVTTQDSELAERLAVFRNHGAKPKYIHHYVGGNFRLDTIQAAYLLIKLRHLDDWHAGRRRNAARYDAHFADVEQVTTPSILLGNETIYNQYVIRAPRRDELQEHLQKHNIGTAIYYPVSLHEQACFAPLGYKRGDLPHAEAAADETLALPIYPELTEAQIDYVADTVKGFFQ